MRGALSILFLLLPVVVTQYTSQTVFVGGCNFTINGLPQFGWTIGRPLKLSISLRQNCKSPAIRMQDPWATADPLAVYDATGTKIKNTSGGLSSGFNMTNISEGQSFTMWPMDRSYWANHNVSPLMLMSNGATSLVNISVVRKLLEDFSCRQLSPLLIAGQTINLTCSISYSGDDIFYNLSVWLRDSLNASSLQVFSLGDRIIAGRQIFTVLYNITSVPEGPNGIRVQTWLQYDSWTYNSTLHNYPQTLYLSGDINSSNSRGYDVPFGKVLAQDQFVNNSQYFVTPLPYPLNQDWIDASDHTAIGDGNSTVLVIDPRMDGMVFTQSFVVAPDTYYVLGLYILNLGYAPPNDIAPQLQLAVTYADCTRDLFPQLDTPTLNHSHWYYFSFMFKTRASRLNLTLYDHYPNSTNGNDFAIDDISLHPVEDNRVLTLSHQMNITSVRSPYYNGTGLRVKGYFGTVNNVSIRLIHNQNSFIVYPLECRSSEPNGLTTCDAPTSSGTVQFTLDYLGWTVTGNFTYHASPLLERLIQLAVNGSISDAEAVDMIASLRNVSLSYDVSLFRLMNKLSRLLLRERSRYDFSADDVSLSGIKNVSVDLSAGTARVSISGGVLNQILKNHNGTADVVMSSTPSSAIDVLPDLNKTMLYSDVVGLTFIDSNGTEIPVNNTDHPIVFTLSTTSPLPIHHAYECLYYDPLTKIWNNITTEYENMTVYNATVYNATVYNATIITCSTNHLTNFSIGVKKIAEDTPVDIDTTPGGTSTTGESNNQSKAEPVHLAWIIAPAAGGSLLLLILLLVVLFVLRRKRRATRMLTDEMVGVDVGQVFSPGSIRVGERINGRVYRGHPDTSDIVAVKELTEKSELKNKREVQAYLRVRHPQIVQYLSTYTGDAEYMVMTYMPMGTLLDYVRKEYEEEQLTKILMDVASALIYMHENDLVHCNLSASKVLLYSENDELRGKVCSLGYSRRPCVLNKGDIAELSPRWMAPELLSDGRCTYKSDVWSFGMMLYECMQSGRQPYSESREEEVRERVERGLSLQPAKDWPALFARIFSECTNKMDERPRSTDVAEMLTQGTERGSAVMRQPFELDNVYQDKE
ncbi:tyrosine-protein kinase Fer-like isoform 3 [Planoprotostelium fungivorum]|uniref:Tyrosine-protein kinase Fer-like isoform 3 n=1 Tax=Planoprotostelium fungivorum TaxID=1890364 RepID=A0A2P6MRG3_9EUKA|nr:tyrosine-protein kinase Fer-like isoform 3 [Planoprotostelium fungivorum]